MPLPRDLFLPEVRASCAIDLIMYFYRHPSVYVTMDALAMRVGHVAAEVAPAVEALTRTGVIVQQRHRTLDAVMYWLAVPPSPDGDATLSMIRWRRQALLISKARDRCRRAAMRATRSDERLIRSKALLETVSRQRPSPLRA